VKKIWKESGQLVCSLLFGWIDLKTFYDFMVHKYGVDPPAEHNSG